ncbi:MAG: FAD-dependent monooxygenase, partial [Alphaproteobacteria bacterium]
GGVVAEEPLGHGYKELAISPGPDGAFRMAGTALHIWPRGGYMLIALPNLDGSFTTTLFLPNEGVDSFATFNTTRDVETFFERNFADAVPLLDDLVDTFSRNPTGSLSTIRCKPWRYRAGAVLLGDAAHAVVPFHGQGMNAGFEDCVALDDCVERLGADWESVFTAFEEERKPNGDAIADMALENYVEMRDSVRDPAFLLQRELAWKLEEMYPDIFIPRYSMVMFHLLPYAEAYARGAIETSILQELTRTAESLDDIDFAHAERLIKEKLVR